MGYQLGVDIGTTHTAAAVLRQGRAEMAPLDGDSVVIPSVVFVESGGAVVVGHAASEQGFADPTRVARAFTRRMGDADPMVLGDTPYPPGELMATLLRRVVDIVAEREGAPPDLVTVAHPAHWAGDRSDLVGPVIGHAGLAGVRALSDSQAAAIYHASTATMTAGDVLVVYDLGGGTFEVSVARSTADGIEIVGVPDGIDRLGGLDFDEAVLAHISAVVGISLDDLDADDPATGGALARLRAECSVVKEALSVATEVSIPVFLPGGESEVKLTRDDLEAMIRPALNETIEVLRRTLEGAQIELVDVDAVILLGGSSRIPLVRRLVSEALGRPVTPAVEPTHAVALGAALSMISWADEPAAGTEPAAATEPESDATTASRPLPSPFPSPLPSPSPEAPASSSMSLVMSLGSVVVGLAIVAAAVGAGTLIAAGQVGAGTALVVAGLAGVVVLMLMLRTPARTSSPQPETDRPREGSSS